MKLFGYELRRHRTESVADAPPSRDAEILNMAAKSVMEEELPSRGGRSTELPADGSLYGLIMSEMNTIKPGFDPKLIDICEYLAKFNGDLSYAVDNIVQLGNTPATITFDDSVTPQQKKEMLKFLMVNEKKIYPGGMNSLQNDLFAQAAIGGAISAEMIPSNGLDRVAKVALVSPKDIRFKYNPKTYDYDPYQKANTIVTSGTGVDQLKKLNPITYKYYAIRRFNDNPHGIPPFIAAFESIEIEKDMLKNFRHIIRKMGLFGFLSVVLAAPRRKQNETDDEYLARTKKHLQDTLPEIEKGYSNGISLGYKGAIEFNLESSTSNVQGARDMFNMITEMKHAGFKQDPLMLGRNFNVAETMARVIMAKLTTQVANFQRNVANFRADVYMMMLLLGGYKLKTVYVDYAPPMIGDRLRDAQAYAAEIENELMLRDKGVQSQQDAANELGFEEAFADRDVDYTVAHQDEISKIKAKPSATDPKNTKDPSQASDATAAGATNYSSIEEFLHQGVPEYPYLDVCDCANHSMSYDVEDASDDLARLSSLYGEAIVKLFKKSVDRAMLKVAEALAEFGTGVSLQQITDRIFYILYTEWGAGFTVAQKVVIQKWVRQVYKFFREDATIFGTGAKVTDATFGLFDVRALTYFQRSDELYLGKFITDKDTRKKITEFIKEKYLKEGIAIGNNKEAIDEFRSQLGDLIEMEDWKIRRIIDTSVNRMRNFGAVAFMQQAGVEQFEVRGIVDHKQCRYCKEMQGKRFNVVTAFNRAENYVKAMPELVGAEFPFITTAFKGDEGFARFKASTPEQLQASGVDLPPYHGHCRDVIIAVL